jgi:hypothetical protein
MTQRESDSTTDERLRRLRDRIDRSTAPDAVLRLSRAVTGPSDARLSHAAVEARLPDYVADELDGLPVAELHADVKHHLDGCADCEARYLSLLDLAHIELTHDRSVPLQVPKPDLSFLPARTPLLDVVRVVAQDVIAALRPDLLGELRTIADGFFRFVGLQGGRLVLARSGLGEALGVDEERLPDSALFLAATQFATQSLADRLTRREIDSLAAGGELARVIAEQAETSARQAGLGTLAARDFARAFADRVARDPALLRDLCAADQ